MGRIEAISLSEAEKQPDERLRRMANRIDRRFRNFLETIKGYNPRAEVFKKTIKPEETEYTVQYVKETKRGSSFFSDGNKRKALNFRANTEVSPGFSATVYDHDKPLDEANHVPREEYANDATSLHEWSMVLKALPKKI